MYETRKTSAGPRFLARGASALYGAAARQRRRWYRAHPDAQRRLRQPVISVGNITVGGRRKTPVVATLASWLLEHGERPAILSRGYARERPSDGVLVVRDAAELRATLAEAGDEPFMLARALQGCAVLVGTDRYAAGRLAETVLGCTVHLLDDGFQHFPVARDLDLVLVHPQDAEQGQLLPSGRLREPWCALEAADALVWIAAPGDGLRARVPRHLGQFTMRQAFGPPRLLAAPPPASAPRPPARVVGVAGIAEPARFFDEVRAAGWELVETLPFPDHHPYRPSDLGRIDACVRQTGAVAVFTTEKDAVRLEAHGELPFPAAVVPLEIGIEPRDVFFSWLADRLASARLARRSPNPAVR